MHEITAKRWARTALIAWLTATLLATGLLALSPSNAYAAAKKAPKLSATSKTVLKGKTFTLKVKNAGKAKVKWASSNKKVATVSKAGKVTAKKAGKATITAKVGKKKLTCKVTVVSNKKELVKRSMNGWWHTGSAFGDYVYIRNGRMYRFHAKFDSDYMFTGYTTSRVSKSKLTLDRIKRSPLGGKSAYLIKVDGEVWYCYNDDDHKTLFSWDGTSYSGGGSLYRASTAEVPSNLRKYTKNH